jgi:hypothetical protein
MTILFALWGACCISLTSTPSTTIRKNRMTDDTNIGKSMQLIRPSWYSYILLFVLVCVLPTGFTFLANHYFGNSNGIKETLVSFIVSALITSGLYFFMYRLDISIQSHSLYIRTGLCTEIIPLIQLRIDQIDAIRIKEKRQWQPKLRENGISLPNYNSGWFLLNNGMSALFVGGGDFFLTIPTKMNSVIMVGAQSPSVLIDAIVRDLET